MFVILSFEIASAAGISDPGRIAAQIVTGIGFLGAGTIIQAKGIVKGLTSAATIWVVASLGMAVGMGLFYFAIIITVVILTALLLLGKVEYTIGVKSRNKYSCTLILSRAPNALERVMTLLTSGGTTIEDLEISRTHGLFHVDFTHFGQKSKVEALHSNFAKMREIQDFQIHFFDFQVTR